MAAEDTPLEKILDSMARDEAVDWESSARDAEPDHRPRIEVLRQISDIAAFHREVQRESERSPRERPADREQPDRWGGLLVLDWLESGPRSDFFRAWDSERRCDVSLELLLPEACSEDRFASLARSSLLQLGHPQLPRVLGIEFHDGRAGAWSEILGGMTLARWIETLGTPPAEELVRLGMQLASMLASLHGERYAHGRIDRRHVWRTASGNFVVSAVECFAPAQSPAELHAELGILSALMCQAASGLSDWSASDPETKTIERLRQLRSDLPAALLDAIASGFGAVDAAALVRAYQACATAPVQNQGVLSRLRRQLRAFGRTGK